MTPTQKRDRLLKYILTIMLICLGIAVGIAIRHYYNIPMIAAINIIDLATLVVTVFLAIYIPGVFDRQMQVRHDKRVLIEDRVDELQGFYRRINLLVQQYAEKPKDVLFIRNTLDVASNRLKVILVLLDFINLKDSMDKEIKEIESLSDEYKALLMNAEPEGENFVYPEEIRKKEEFLYNQIDKATSILVFKISDI